jgi:3-oxoacyl-[acyl-carrier protein] reductase
MFDLTGKTALITGASGSLGGAIALAFGNAGADIACHYHTNRASAEQVAGKLTAMGRRAVVLGADLSDPDEAEKLVERTVEALGDIHILVNNAGVNREALLIRETAELVDEVLKINLAAMLHMSRAAARRMARNHWGRLIHLGSVVAHTGSTAQAAYAASKAGVEGMSRAIAREMGGRNITSNVIAPGFIGGGMSERMSEGRKGELVRLIALARVGKPDEIGAVAVFLASEEAGYITGEVLHVNGGMFMD